MISKNWLQKPVFTDPADLQHTTGGSGERSPWKVRVGIPSFLFIFLILKSQIHYSTTKVNFPSHHQHNKSTRRDKIVTKCDGTAASGFLDKNKNSLPLVDVV